MGEGDLRTKVRTAYSSAADAPASPHAFPVGRAFAESLGYPAEWLAQIPADSVEAFAGVSNVPLFAELPADGMILDLGCGAGLDSLLLALRTGNGRRVIGIDFSGPMLRRARASAAALGTSNVLFVQADAEQIPLAEGALDGSVVNGIFNLNPARDAIFHELARCIRPGGRLYAAELILAEPLPPEAKVDESNWFAWIAGAKEGGAFLDEFRRAGFREAHILRTMRNARTKSPAVLAAEIVALK